MTGIAKGKLKLWFFRDLNDEQREKLFALFQPKEDNMNMGTQAHCLEYVVKKIEDRL